MVITIRNSSKFLIFTSLGFCVLLLLALHAMVANGQVHPVAIRNSALVKRLRLTDLCLFTEARYTRHPSMADLHAPFQEHPAALEHFPSGSLVMPIRPRRSH